MTMRTIKLGNLCDEDIAKGGWISVAEAARTEGVTKQTILNRVRNSKVLAGDFHGLTMVRVRP